MAGSVWDDGSAPAAPASTSGSVWESAPSKPDSIANLPTQHVDPATYEERAKYPLDEAGRAQQMALDAKRQKAGTAFIRNASALTSPLSPVGMTIGADVRDLATAKDPGEFMRRAVVGGPAARDLEDRLGKGALSGHFFDSLNDAEQEYRLLNSRNLGAIRDQGSGPLSAAAGAALEHPYLTGAADFAGELLNPTFGAAGEVLGPAARAAGKMALRVPGVAVATGVARDAGKGATSAFDRYQEVREGRAKPGEKGYAPAGGDNAEAFTHQAESNMAAASNRAKDITERVFGDRRGIPANAPIGDRAKDWFKRAGGVENLTKEEQQYVWDRSYRIDPDSGIEPRPIDKALDAEILRRTGVSGEQRARELQAYEMDVEQRAAASGAVDPEHLYTIDAHGVSFKPMKEYNGRPVYSDQTAVRDDGTVPLSEARLQKNVSPRAGMTASRRFLSGQKDYHLPTYMMPEGKLHEDFLPAHQIMEHYGQVERAIELAEMLKRGESVPLGDDMAAAGLNVREPVKYNRNLFGTVYDLGQGDKGRQAAIAMLTRQRTFKEMQDAAARVGRPDLVNYRNNPLRSATYLQGVKRGLMRNGRALPGPQRQLERIAAKEAVVPPETPNLFRYQSTPGAPETSPLRGGTFFSNQHVDTYNEAGKRTGGTNLVKAVAAAKNPLNVGEFSDATGMMALSLLLKDPNRFRDLRIDRNIQGPAGQKYMRRYLRALGVSADQAASIASEKRDFVFYDRLAAEIARRQGYDAIVSTGPHGEYFALTPEAYRVPGVGQIPKHEAAVQSLEAADAARGKTTGLLADALAQVPGVKAGLAAATSDASARAKSLAGELAEARNMAVGSKDANAAVRDLAKQRFAERQIVEKPVWDALAQHGGRITADMIQYAPGKWKIAGEFDDIPKRLLKKPDVLDPNKTRVDGNLDQVAAAARMPVEEFKAFLAENPRRSTFADAMRYAQENAPKDLGFSRPEDVAAKQREVFDAVQATHAAHGAKQGAQTAFDTVVPAAHGAVNSSEQFTKTLDEATAKLRDTHADTVAGITRVSKSLEDRGKQIVVELGDLTQKIAAARGDKALHDAITAQAQRAVAGYAQSIAEEVDQKWGKLPAGYVRENTLQIGSRFGGAYGIPAPIAKLFTEPITDARGNDAHEALGNLMRGLQTMTNVARNLIVSVAIIHVFGNLGTAYLADMKYSLDGFKRFAEIAAMRRVPTPAQIHELERAGALPGNQGRLIGDYEHGDAEVLTRSARELSPAQRADQYISRKIWEPNQKLVFETYEGAYAWDAYSRRIAQGMAPAQAGREVRKLFGDYRNITGLERKLGLNRLMFFYPWLKTALRFWVHQGLFAPNHTLLAPAAGVETANTIQGYDDPTQPFTVTTGRDGNGSFRRTLLPLPQRIDENVGRAAMLPIDAARALASGEWGHLPGDLYSASGIPANRLNPLVSSAVGALYRGGSAAIHGKPPTAADLIEGAATSLGPTRGIGQMLHDPVGGGLTLAGGFTYSVPGGGMSNHDLRAALADIAQLRAMGRDDDADAMLAALRKAQGAAP